MSKIAWAALSILFGLQTAAYAGDYRCRWAATPGALKGAAALDPVNHLQPIVTKADFCDTKPICWGKLYCTYKADPGKYESDLSWQQLERYNPPYITQASCYAVKAGNDWVCPNAEACQIDSAIHIGFNHPSRRSGPAPAPEEPQAVGP